MAQSLQTITPEKYRKSYEKVLLNQAKKENLNKRFLLGEGLDKDKFLHASMMYDVLCLDSCDMYNYVWQKIKGELKENCPKTYTGFYKVQKIYTEVKKQPKTCDVIEECTQEIEW